MNSLVVLFLFISCFQTLVVNGFKTNSRLFLHQTLLKQSGEGDQESTAKSKGFGAPKVFVFTLFRDFVNVQECVFFVFRLRRLSRKHRKMPVP